MLICCWLCMQGYAVPGLDSLMWGSVSVNQGLLGFKLVLRFLMVLAGRVSWLLKQVLS
jgi:hypothetical protein